MVEDDNEDNEQVDDGQGQQYAPDNQIEPISETSESLIANKAAAAAQAANN